MSRQPSRVLHSPVPGESPAMPVLQATPVFQAMQVLLVLRRLLMLPVWPVLQVLPVLLVLPESELQALLADHGESLATSGRSITQSDRLSTCWASQPSQAARWLQAGRGQRNQRKKEISRSSRSNSSKCGSKCVRRPGRAPGVVRTLIAAEPTHLNPSSRFDSTISGKSIDADDIQSAGLLSIWLARSIWSQSRLGSTGGRLTSSATPRSPAEQVWVTARLDRQGCLDKKRTAQGVQGGDRNLHLHRTKIVNASDAIRIEPTSR